MKNVLVAGLLAGIVLFVWGALFWSVLPSGGWAFGSLEPSTSSRLGDALLDDVPEAGTYLIPDAALPPQEFVRRHQQGPIAMLLVRPYGMPAMPPSTFVLGFVHLAGACIVVALLLKMTASAFSGFAQRFLFVILCFLFATILVDANTPIWWRGPWDYPLVTGLFHLTGGALVAGVLAYFVSDNA